MYLFFPGPTIMEALMSQILTSARMKVPPQEQPLDLAWSCYTRHTCDRLLHLENLRAEQEPAYTTEEEEDSPAESTCSSSPDVADAQQDRVKREHYPFSIAALIGESGSDVCGNPDQPAQVYSPFMDYGMRYKNFFSQMYEIGTNNPASEGVCEMSPIRAVSMLNTRNIYWCHVCSTLCEDQKEADRHRICHRLRGDTCSLRRTFAKDHGYVTRHEMLDSERLMCGLCSKVVSTCFFHKHQRLHDGHVCQFCGQEFSTNSRLRDHVNVHTGSTPFACAICDRKFAKRSSLTQHQRYHRDHKSFMCRFCHKCFNSKYACAVHERLHTGENPFRCQFPGCTRAFPQKIQLKLHINSHHRA